MTKDYSKVRNSLKFMVRQLKAKGKNTKNVVCIIAKITQHVDTNDSFETKQNKKNQEKKKKTILFILLYTKCKQRICILMVNVTFQKFMLYFLETRNLSRLFILSILTLTAPPTYQHPSLLQLQQILNF